MPIQQANSDPSPRFLDGLQQIRLYLKTVVDKSLNSLDDRFGEKASRKRGDEDGLYAQGNIFTFQDNCREGYANTVNDLRTAADELINKERDYIDTTLETELPDLQQEVNLKMTNGLVQEWVEKMENCAAKKKKLNEFLGQRGMTNCLERGDSAWYFWLPLISVVFLEFVLNYLFLGEISVRAKMSLAAIAVFFVLVAGWSVSWLYKERRSVIVRNNKFHMFQKHGWTFAIIVVLAFFFYALSLFIYFRANIPFPANLLKMITGLPNAVSKNGVEDFALAALNVAGLFIAMRTFAKAGWPVHGYERVAALADEAKSELEKCETSLNGLAVDIFRVANEALTKRRYSCRNIRQHEIKIQDVCRTLPDAIGQEWDRIDRLYRTSIRLYREHLRQQRNPCETREIDGVLVPIGFRTGDLIEDLPRPDYGDNAGLHFIENFHFVERAEQFEARATQWTQENAVPDELIEYARDRKSRLMSQIVKIREDAMEDGG